MCVSEINIGVSASMSRHLNKPLRGACYSKQNTHIFIRIIYTLT